MKIIDIIEEYKALGHSQDENTLSRYKYNDDVITSYTKNSFGIMFLIKGKVKPFAFAIIKRKLSYNYYNLKQIKIKDYFEIRDKAEQENQETVFIDEEKEKQIKALCLLEELKDKN